MSTFENPKLRELHGWRLYGYTLGTFGLMLGGFLAGNYSMIYYIYTINIDAGFAAGGSSLSLWTTAFATILFGVIIDNKKPNKLGKRRPFILIGLPLWIVTMILLWFPPLPPMSETTVIYWPTILWYYSLNFIRAISRAIITIAFSSMFPEQSQTLKNREKVSYIQSILMIINSVVSLGIPLVLQSLVVGMDKKYWASGGIFITRFIVTASLILIALGTIFMLLGFFAVDESFHDLNEKFNKRKVKDALVHLFTPLRDKKYLKLLGMRISGSVGGRIIGMMVIPFTDFVLGMNFYLGNWSDAQKGFLFWYYPIVSFTSKFLWLWIWKKIFTRKGDLMKTYRLCYIVYFSSAAAEVLFFFVYPYWLTLVIFYLVYGTLLGAMYAMNMFRGPVMNAIIDEAAIKIANKSNSSDLSAYNKAITSISGSYYGLLNLSFSVGSAITTMIVGIILTGNEENPVVINSIFTSQAIFFFISWIILRTLKINLKNKPIKEIIVTTDDKVEVKRFNEHIDKKFENLENKQKP